MRSAISFRAAAAILIAAVPAPAAAQDPDAGALVVTQICLAPATVEAAPNGVDPVSAVRDAFATMLTGPTLAVQPLSARLASQVRQEAKLAGCRFLVLTTVKHERKTGGGGILGRMAGGAVQQGAWAATGAAGGSTVGRVVAGAAAGAASSSINDYAMNSRQKDELTLGWQLEAVDGRVLLDESAKRKAKSDGEDILTPVVQKAAERIAGAVAQ